ncbi:MAG: hypothetical protein IKO47_01185 [Ruminococcus sp.]|nr:hypothetical protein [Ruminococcus sp.]
MNKVYTVKLGRAKCAVDLGDGSERGEYVSQDYILSRLGRPHRAVSLMYCYYPFDKEWPQRISEAVSGEDISFQWDYPYDDYFPYTGGIGGSREGEPFTSMRDIRRHGQDVILTITMDPAVTDEQLAAIGDDLRSFGRMFLRINHEATGNWFSFNKRASYQEVADFYCRAVRIIREHAPNVMNNLCIGGIEDMNSTEAVKEKEFSQAVKDTDIWSVDKYLALHWGWPYDIAEPGGRTQKRSSVRKIFSLTKRSYERFCQINGGVPKPMLMSECNADGDVTGASGQAEMVRLFYDMIKEEKAEWLSGVCFYQFRDRGRLGLEIQDPNCPEVGIEQPVMQVYRDIISDEWFRPEMTEGAEASLPAVLRWGSSEDAEGIAIPVHLERDPVFFELNFRDSSNLMIEIDGRWFYKSPSAKCLDLMPAFYGKEPCGERDTVLRIFAPPASGENDISTDDGLMNYYFTLESLPEIRLRYEPAEQSLD